MPRDARSPTLTIPQLCLVFVALAFAACTTSNERIVFEATGGSDALAPVSVAGGSDPAGPRSEPTGGTIATGGTTHSATGGTSGSSDAGAPTASSSGGATGNGGSGSSGTGGAAVSLVSRETPKRDACRAYFRAFCEKQGACRGWTAKELAECYPDPPCPDAFFSDGSNQTVETVKACTAAVSRQSCDDYLNHQPLDCAAIPGKRAEGEACIEGTQCQSSRCDNAPTYCGVCARILEPFAACGEAGTACPSPQYCNTQAGACVEAAPIEPFVAPKRGKPGDECFGPLECDVGAYCQSTTPPQSVCAASPGLGQACAETPLHACGAQSYCDETTRLCSELPGASEPCAKDGSQMLCADGLYCALEGPASGTCLPIPGVGDACSGNLFRLIQANCAAGLVCSCADKGCTSSKCVEFALEGEACGPLAACQRGTTCEAGICQPSEALTREALCQSM